MFSVLCSLEYINYVLMCELLYVCVTAPHNVKHWQNAGLKFSVVVFSLSDNQELISNKDELFKFMNLQFVFKATDRRCIFGWSSSLYPTLWLSLHNVQSRHVLPMHAQEKEYMCLYA